MIESHSYNKCKDFWPVLSCATSWRGIEIGDRAVVHQGVVFRVQKGLHKMITNESIDTIWVPMISS